MAEDAPSHLIGEIEALAVLLELIHHPKRLLVVAEGISQHLSKGSLAGVPEGGVAEIMAHCRSFGQILVQPQGAGCGAGNAGHFQGVGHAGAVVVALGLEKNLGLVHQPSERTAVEDAIGIPLITGPILALFLEDVPPPGIERLSGTRTQARQLLLLLELSEIHGCTRFPASRIIIREKAVKSFYPPWFFQVFFGNARYSSPTTTPRTRPAVTSTTRSRKACSFCLGKMRCSRISAAYSVSKIWAS